MNSCEYAPLLVTLGLCEADANYFDRLRREHFPKDKNFIGAHVTLFHALPSEADLMITAALQAAATVRRAEEFELIQVLPPRSIGRGVAYFLHSKALQSLHTQLHTLLSDLLTPQDRSAFRPHIVVQNKVSLEESRELLARLRADFRPTAIKANGLLLWSYEGGPWRHLRSFPFSGAV